MTPLTFKLVALSATLACAFTAEAQTAKKVQRKAQPMITEVAEPEVEAYSPGSPGLFGARYPGWNTNFTAPAGPVKLSEAILAVFPADHPTAKLEFEEKLAFTMVELNGKLSRRNALDLGLRKAGLGGNIEGGLFTVYAARNAQGALMAQQAGAAPSASGSTFGAGGLSGVARTQVTGQASQASPQAQLQQPPGFRQFSQPTEPLQPSEFQKPRVVNTVAPNPGQATKFRSAAAAQPVQPVSVASLSEAPGAIEGDLKDPSWFNPAPAFSAPMPTAQAIGFLFPPEHPTAQLIIESDISRKTSTWRNGINRRQAMSSVLGQAGLSASFNGGVFRVRAATGTVPVQAQPPVVAQQAPFVRQPSPPIQPRPDAQPGQTWTVNITDVNLANTFTRWAQDAGYKVKWDAPKHVLIGANQNFIGNFEEAVEQALDTPGIRNSLFPLEVCIYANSPPLARITRLGEQLNDCK